VLLANELLDPVRVGRDGRFVMLLIPQHGAHSIQQSRRLSSKH
jgi:hypothetical protein